MILFDELDFKAVTVQPINEKIFSTVGINLDVLRLDKIHPVISGNKWFKLKYYLQTAIEKNYTAAATFGGAYSNHILATAYACNKNNLPCTGFIRGEEPKQYAQTLVDAKALNMQLVFVGREDYRRKENIINAHSNLFFIPEGGYGSNGAKGATEILQLVPGINKYNHIVCAVGTGTMLAGLINASLPHQTCIGISALKNNLSIQEETEQLINNKQTPFKILHDYSFGGYAKHTQQLIKFMNEIYNKHQLPLDFVYTAKAFFAVYDLINKHFFNRGSNILFVHSGGLQGNRSLNNELVFNNLA